MSTLLDAPALELAPYRSLENVERSARIADLAHLCWSLENIAAGHPVNVIRVDDPTARESLVAWERMLQGR